MKLVYSFEADAESQCEDAINSAVQLNPSSIDAIQSRASLRISQCRLSDAASICEQLGPAVLALRRQLHARKIVDEFSVKSTSSLEPCGDEVTRKRDVGLLLSVMSTQN
jgi:hypothetical protein